MELFIEMMLYGLACFLGVSAYVAMVVGVTWCIFDLVTRIKKPKFVVKDRELRIHPPEKEHDVRLPKP